MTRMLCLLPSVSLSLCASLGLLACSDGPESYGDDLADSQIPPRGHADVLTWLEAGHYQGQGWSCEEAPHAARPRSPHGQNRICSNTALAGFAGDGPYPVGAAGVKEIFNSSGQIRLYAVYRKVAEGTGGDTWYWYEGTRGDVIANGEGDSTCTDCHSGAPQDFVFTVVK